MNGLYVLAAIVAPEYINNRISHVFKIIFANLFFTCKIFLKIGIEQIMAAAKIISSYLST